MTKQQTYIDVAVPLPVQSSYTYRAPEEMVPFLEIGKRVLVPFGKRKLTGYILKIINENSLQDTAFKIKPIIEILDKIPLFHDSHTSFFKWIANYYLHPLGEVIKSALPGGINIKEVMTASITPHGRDACISDSAMGKNEHNILSALINGPKSLKTLVNGNKAITLTKLQTLEKKELLTLKRELEKATVKEKKERFIKSTGDSLPIDTLTEKRQSLITIIRSEQEISVKDLKKRIPTATGFFKFLESHGYISFFEKTIYRDPLGEPIEKESAPTLMPEQKTVISELTDRIGTGFHPFVLAGVTGSGKTEVYMQLIEDALKKGLSGIVLVPEIALISQTERRFRSRFGNKVAVIHSGLSQGEKFDQWLRIANKEINIVIGARSAIFAPVENPGIIIVDEEHDNSYKQESGLRYNARDLAVVRAKLSGAVFLSGSATPSIQSWYNTQTGKFSALKLTKRVSNRPMPAIDIVDLKRFRDLPGMRSFITPPLERLMKETLEKKEQVLLFLNRRGYANYPVCATCGMPMKCTDCDVTLTLHKNINSYRCHMCGYIASALSHCRICNSSQIKHLGFGTEKIEAAVSALFPEASVARMDQDTTSRKGSVIRILKNVKERKTDILIGTQMIAKGHDFPGITLVGIICADQSLNFPDFRACERTFQLLAQVAGRAGRGDQPGKVILQTYNPDHFSITAAQEQDFYRFYDSEIQFRQSLEYPPCSRMMMIRISAPDSMDASNYASETGRFLNNHISGNGASFNRVSILGPIEAAIPKMANRYRWQILLKSPSASQLHNLGKILLNEASTGLKQGKHTKDIRLSIDIDPYSMM